MKASQKTMGVLVMTFIAIVLGAITFSQKGQEWVNPYTGNVVLKSNLQLVIYLVPTMVAIFGVLWFAAKKEDDTGSVAIPNKGWKRIQKSCVTPMSAALLLIIVAIILLARSPQEAKPDSQYTPPSQQAVSFSHSE
jgi:uncharacterized membrane protein YoaK (UPF0700 family)